MLKAMTFIVGGDEYMVLDGAEFFPDADEAAMLANRRTGVGADFIFVRQDNGSVLYDNMGNVVDGTLPTEARRKVEVHITEAFLRKIRALAAKIAA